MPLWSIDACQNSRRQFLTTPEQLSLLLAHREAETFFAGLRTIVLDELHALVTSKRGDLLSLALARVRRLAPAEALWEAPSPVVAVLPTADEGSVVVVSSSGAVDELCFV